MGRRFWRNVVYIALAHLAVLVVLLRWAKETNAASAPEITWLSGGAQPEGEGPVPTPEPAMSPPPQSVEATPAAQSEIILPAATATPTPRATPSSTSKVTVKPTASPKRIAKKTTTPRASASPARKKAAALPGKKEGVAKRTGAKSSTASNTISTGGSGEGANGSGSGKSDVATANYYGNMLHDRFYHAWEQPRTVVASGVRLSAVARVRIEKDGRVSDFKMVKPSGNVLVDESVEDAGKKVTQVDALPVGMGTGGHYDVNINFALNSE